MIFDWKWGWWNHCQQIICTALQEQQHAWAQSCKLGPAASHRAPPACTHVLELGFSVQTPCSGSCPHFLLIKRKILSWKVISLCTVFPSCVKRQPSWLFQNYSDRLFHLLVKMCVWHTHTHAYSLLSFRMNVEAANSDI